MRVFTAELRRLLKTRSVLALMLAALILAPVQAYFPASFASWTYRDESGQEVRVEGREALKLEEENQTICPPLSRSIWTPRVKGPSMSPSSFS